MISGKDRDVVHVRATLAEQLAFSKAYLTWTKEANALEDRLGKLWRTTKSAPPGEVPPEPAVELKAIHREIKALDHIPYEEWEVLSRGALLVERGLLRVAAGVVDGRATAPTGAPRPALRSRRA